MNPIAKYLIAAAALATISVASAKPAKPGYFTVYQPDGTSLIVRMIGNDRMHFTLTDDDKIVIQDADGQYSYASFADDGSLLSTRVMARRAANRAAVDEAVAVDINDVDINAITATRARNNGLRRSNSVSGLGKFTSNFPTKGNVHGIVILVNFTDLTFKDDSNYATTAKDYFTNMINQEGFSEWGGTGCTREYFERQSNGQFLPTFDVVGPYTVSRGYAYYGANNSWGWDAKAAKMIAEACKLANDDVNFADYDNDGDGYCDYVYVIYAGPSESSGSGSNYIWPHSYHLSYTNDRIKLDGVYIDNYACSNEWEDSNPDGMGTFTHEFSHVMGLPDIYYTGSSTRLYCTPGYYDALDVGCYNNNSRTIPAYSAYERNALGWIDLKELTESENVTLSHIEDSNEACVIRTTNDNEFYLIENRQQDGWDKYIPGHGMLIWHIDFDQKVYDNNAVNNTESHQYVDIVEANENALYYDMDVAAGWTWPGTSGKTEFSSSTSPSLIDWSDAEIDMPISDIAETADGLITFNVKGGVESGVAELPATENSEAPEVYFNLMGQRVIGDAHGIYIVRDANGTRKVVR